MDIAAFVGFAESGPLHTPVPVEDAVRFREIFGRDVRLGHDVETGRAIQSTLGPTVEAFLANGGQRCQVVRVGDPTTQPTRFKLPYIVRAHGEIDFAPVELVARSPGTAFDELRAGTVLRLEQLIPTEFTIPTDSPRGDDLCGGHDFRLRITPSATVPEVGELIELRFGREEVDGDRKVELVLRFFVDAVAHRPGEVDVCGSRGYWFVPESELSSPIVSPAVDDDEVEDPLVPIGRADGGARFAARFASSPPHLPVVHMLRFDLLAWRGDDLVARLSNLAFCSAHDRFFGDLPDDERLFGRRSLACAPGAEPIDPVESPLWRDADTPRFPFAAFEVHNKHVGPTDFLPAKMPRKVRPERDSAVRPADDSPLARNGLQRITAELFFDAVLASVRVGSLLGEAEHERYIVCRELTGLHSLLGVAEVTILSLPDAVHVYGELDTPETKPLVAPHLEQIDRPSGHDIDLTWTAVAGATSYVVESDTSPAFDQTRRTVATESNAATLSFPPLCVQTRCFRVRAMRYGEPGPWSNTRVVDFPSRDFIDCNRRNPADWEIVLTAASLGSPGEWLLSWYTESDAVDSPLIPAWPVELQEAGDMGFQTTRVIAPSDFHSHRVSPSLASVRFYRVRIVDDADRGPWSNTVCIDPVNADNQPASPLSHFQRDELLDVHRAALRFCAARGDLLAVLSLPLKDRERDIDVWRSNLTSPLVDRSSFGASRGVDDAPIVPPLSIGERFILRYGSVYHPWVVRSAARGDEPTNSPRTAAYIPPDGFVCGTMARLALERGAWIAPANRALVDSLGPVRELSPDGRVHLAGKQINVIHRVGRPTIADGADTLAEEHHLRPIGVRRLLILLRRLALREGETYVFEANNNDFRNQVRHRFERLLSTMFVNGAFAGGVREQAYRVVVDESVNTPQSVDRGRFIVELRIAPARPMAFLTVRLVQSGSGQATLQEL